MNIEAILQAQKEYFATQQTKDISFRKAQLKKLQIELIKREPEIVTALHNDFKKSEFEAILTETSIILAELKTTLKKTSIWAKPKRVLPALLNFPSSAKILKEPYGNTLIIAPWNYPFQLALSPLIGAVAAGNTVVLKPSELTPYTSAILKKIITNVFNPTHVCVIEGGVTVSESLLKLRWDYIFFTGSVSVGKIVAKAAAANLTPVTLELGGKSPCIIDNTANTKLAAKRLVWGKFLNGGQTCIAPDYLLIHRNVKDVFTKHFKEELIKAYGKNPEKSTDFPRIVNTKNYNRLVAMLQNEEFLIGGNHTKSSNYISPTLIDEPSLDSEVMKGEIFGPILPVISYTEETEIEIILKKYDKPLAFYIFTTNKKFANKLISKYSFGGGTINDTTIHFVNERLPFGGVGESGIGSYHGKLTFNTFSHSKGVVTKANWLDLPIRYAPYTNKLKKLRALLKWS